MAAATTGGGSGSAADDRVHRIVAAGESAESVRRAIEECARGDEQQRAAAVKQRGQGGETPLQAAHRLVRGDLVGLLLEAGADARDIFLHGHMTPLALCAAYGQVDSLRALLRAGHDPNETLDFYSPAYTYVLGRPCTAALLCMAPPRLSPSDDEDPPPQLACFEALVLEGGADVNATGEYGYTPLLALLGHVAPGDGHVAAIDLLIRLGADVHARDELGRTPACLCAGRLGDLAGLRRLLEHGASVDVTTPDGITPLMYACLDMNRAPDRRELVLEVARRSSPETRRAVGTFPGPLFGGRSAVDVIFETGERAGLPLDPWHKQIIGELLADGASVLPQHRGRVLPTAAAHAARREAEVAARRAELLGWRAQEVLVGLAQDFKELGEDEAAVAQKLARVEALKQELRDLGAGSDTSNSDESESGSSSSGSESESDESDIDDDDEEGGGGK